MVVASISPVFSVSLKYLDAPKPLCLSTNDSNTQHYSTPVYRPMSHNQRWWESVRLPKTIPGWTKEANNTYFEDPRKKKTSTTEQQDSAGVQSYQRHINPKKLHVGEKW